MTNDLTGWQAVAREIGDHHIAGWGLSVLKSGPEHTIGDWLPAEAAAKEILRLRERVKVLEDVRAAAVDVSWRVLGSSLRLRRALTAAERQQETDR